MNNAAVTEKILVIRFSALGDVAMTVPVIKSFLIHYPHKEILMLGDKKLADLFVGIERLEFIGASMTGEHEGIIGMIRLFNSIRKKYIFNSVADLHGVLRTHLLRFLFTMVGKHTAVIDKGRFEKFALTRRETKIFRPLPHTTERYSDVFAKLGFPFDNSDLVIHPNQKSKSDALNAIKKIGFAPFAKHGPKMYPLDSFKEIIQHFDSAGNQLYLFGGRGAEGRMMNVWRKQFNYIVSQEAHAGLKEELEIMKGLDLMVTMDSANMHLASLVNVPVVSIWGPTHPYTGFYGYNQDPTNAVQVNMSCRPCSVFGNKACWRGDHACMKQITPQMVIEKMETVLRR